MRHIDSQQTTLGAFCLAGLVLALTFNSFAAESVVGSKHDLSSMGPGPIKALTETEVCIFCHTPHSATPQTPLWNRKLSDATYVPYSSSTVKATIGQPTGASKLCLSCHDGTVALGMVNTRPVAIEFSGGVSRMPSGRSNLGTDLSDDHPISFVFDSALATAKGGMKDPSLLTDRVRLDHRNEMQCTSCHDPHNNEYGKFLVQENRNSALCLNCHDPGYWAQSTHHTSNKRWSGTGVDPWPNTEYQTVAENGCASCHATHNAGIRQRLFTYADEERNCFSCHSGNVAEKNIEAEFTKFSTHPIYQTTGVHDPMEDPINPPRHVECADCHNPHASTGTQAMPPNASGALAGVAGVNSSGAIVDPLRFEYELCFKCHGDSAARGPARIDRQNAQTNTRLEFSPDNASFHPVVVQSPANSPSLIAPLHTASMIACTDCHNSDRSPAAGGTGPNGPHGSAYPPLLERQLLLTDDNTENSGTYALCYKCHSRESILSNQSFSFHKEHIVDHRTACTTCHDAHASQDSKHLINFNRRYVTTSSNGLLEYRSTGINSGNCSLTCHNHDHVATPYAPRLGGAVPLLQQQKTPNLLRPRSR